MGSVISKILDEERVYRPLCKPVNKESLIRWQTREPTKEGKYIVTLLGGAVTVDELYSYEYIKGSRTTIKYAWRRNFQDAVIAWCKLSDIKPYK